MMLVYGLLKDGQLPPPPELNGTTRTHFSRLLSKRSGVLKSLYKDDKHVVENLEALVNDLDEEYLTDTNAHQLLVAYIIMMSNCSTLHNCPNLERSSDIISHWAFYGSGLCELARALYFLKLQLEEELIYPNIWTSKFDPMVYSLVHSESFIDDLINRSRVMVDTPKLDDDMESLSPRDLCTTKADNGLDDNHIILPMLFWNLTAHYNISITIYAFLYANAVSFKRELCGEVRTLPSMDCEWVPHLFIVFNHMTMDSLYDSYIVI